MSPPAGLMRRISALRALLKHTAAPACWSLGREGSCEDMVLRLVNMGGDSDTAGAVTGMLPGACHRLQGIPEQMVSDLA